ncbi:Domain of uncharacterised function (DUF2825) [Salmonella enterica subsp. enterica]|nr:Domain of uncharacterised function (DUF2825) [Salmonella enterica subsp. enterica]
MPRHLNARFIPAGAGNTYAMGSKDNARAVYPRWRGEHHLCATRFIRGRGLSPLARGTRGFSHPEPRHARFIPAGAGNTTKSAARSPALTVYPRWRGEHLPIVVSAASEHGLSPLARGTRLKATIITTHFAVYPRWRGEHPIPVLTVH